MRTAQPLRLAPVWWTLLAFLSARLMILMIWPAEQLTHYGDYHFFFRLAALSEIGHWPFVHYWSEYPPLFPLLVNLPLYWLSGGVFKNYVVLLGITLLACEVGCLYLLYSLARAGYGQARALRSVWIYAALYVPVFIWLGTFEALVSLFVLGGIGAWLRRRDGLAGLCLGLGAMTKLWPLGLLALAWRAGGWRSVWRSGLVALSVCLVFLAPLYILSPEFTVASLLAQASKSSWQTVWALLDGNLSNTGNFGPLIERFSPTRATAPLYHPSRVPAWLTLLPFAAIAVFALTRQPAQCVARDIPTMAALLVMLFFLWSKGWSPQWQLVAIPLLLLALPWERAVLFIVVLGLINALEWPVILSRGLTSLLPITIGLRTLVLAVLTWELYQRLTSSPPRTKLAVAQGTNLESKVRA
ncbi:MAG: glycosyltransferase 87 family protein [Anaerolineae bacterium]|nr:glycosyltransferase 87 family protein [Anaerolineae bacterium]MDW8070459.1 glycosyltransferase 87 family protein [Anaerolineae bacterium]